DFEKAWRGGAPACEVQAFRPVQAVDRDRKLGVKSAPKASSSQSARAVVGTQKDMQGWRRILRAGAILHPNADQSASDLSLEKRPKSRSPSYRSQIRRE